MKYLYNYHQLLSESKRIDDLYHKYVEKQNLDKAIFDEFINTQYAEWLLKVYTTTSKDEIDKIEKKGLKFHDLLLSLIQIFDNNKKNLSEDQITKIKDFNALRKIVDEVTQYDEAKKRYGDDIWILENSYEWFIFKPYSYDASEDYGNRKQRSENWCTTYSTEEFRNYRGGTGGLLYFINKLDYTQDIAFQIKNPHEINIFNYLDSKIHTKYSFNNAATIFEKSSIPYKVIMGNLEALEDEHPGYTDEEIEEHFYSYLDNFYDEENAFSLLIWIYNLYNDISDIANCVLYDDNGKLLDLLIKNYPNKIKKFDDDLKNFIKLAATYIPADYICKKYNIEISNQNSSASDKWTEISNHLTYEQKMQILKDENLDENLELQNITDFKKDFKKMNTNYWGNFDTYDYELIFEYFFKDDKNTIIELEKILNEKVFDYFDKSSCFDAISNKLSIEEKEIMIADFDFD
ncbi:hypothetical protein M0Q97_01545 [Candidatus Dojkabacteria bacterium]|jgi:hypothetical protein|nr:hypothetical protein [Candidatus Dojkabacteria bacterium]